MLVQSHQSALGASALTKPQLQALDVSPELIAQLPIEQRIDLLFRHAELKALKSDAFWNAVQGVALGVIPILAFLGVSEFFRRGKKKRK